MNLYHISQDVNHWYDTFSDVVVAAETEDAARLTSPSDLCKWTKADDYSSWAKPEQVKVKLLGKALEGTEAGVICASFHAG